MARLTSENNPEHLAALHTPKQKGGKSRFRDFFKSGHSRSSLSSIGSSPPASPFASTPLVSTTPVSTPPIPASFMFASPMSQLGADNLKSGLENVGVHSEERAKERAKEREWMIFDDWERIKDENPHLTHDEKILLYKAQGALRYEPDESGETMLTRSATGTNERQQDEDAHEGPGVPSEATGHDSTTAIDETVIREREGDQENAISEWVADPRGRDPDDEKAESIRKTCEDSISSAASNDHDISKDPAEYVSEPGFLPPSVRGAIQHVDSPFLRSSPLQDSRIGAYPDQSNMDDTMSDISEPRDDITVRAVPFDSLDRKVTDAINPPETMSSRREPDDIHDTNRGTLINIIEHVRAKLLEDTGKQVMLVPEAEVYKVGPLTVDDDIAMALITVPSVLYATILFITAIEGPYQFLMLVWRLVIIFIAYKGVSVLSGWQEDGTCDVMLVPAEGVYGLVKVHIAGLVTAVFEHFAQTMVSALKEAVSENEV